MLPASEPICTPEGGYDYEDDEVELGFGAGCSTTGDASSLGLFAVGLALVTLRRRRAN